MLDCLQDSGIDELLINGDLLDFYSVNMHGPKHPEIIETLESEFYWGLEFIKRVRKLFPKQKITFNFGNHEDRLDRWILKNCKPFWGIVKLERMLQLDEYDINYFHYNNAYRIHHTNLYAQHSPPSYSENTASTSLKKKLGASFIYACTHRKDYACRTLYNGDYQEVWSNGWLGSTTLTKEHARVFSYAKGHQNWQNCFALIDVYNKKEYHVEQPLIKNYRLKLDGHIYEG